MKIAVFGDSFAEQYNTEKIEPFWWQALGEKYNVTNYGISASNLFYSFDAFQREHDRYDKIIFLVTSPGRLRIVTNIPDLHSNHRYIPSHMMSEYHISRIEKEGTSTINDLLIEIYNAARVYFLHLRDFKYENTVARLFVNEIKRIRSDSILIPCFADSYGTKTEFSLFDVCDRENIAWGLDRIKTMGYTDRRACHMTVENNLILAEKIDQAIKTNSELSLTINDFVIPSMDSKNQYIELL